MEERIAKAVREFPGRAGLYCQELDTGREWAVRGEEPFEAASVIKLPILVEVFRQLESGEAREDGAVLGNVWGTYLHGLLDSGELLARLWRALAEKKGLSPEEAPACDPAAYREEQYRTLAAALRQSLDMDRIYRILEEGI